MSNKLLEDAVRTTEMVPATCTGSPLLDRLPMSTPTTIVTHGAFGYREATVVKRGSDYLMYSDAVASGNPEYPDTFGSVIHLFTTSDDMQDWDSTSFAAVGEVIGFGAGGTYNAGGVATPSAIDVNGVIYCFYSGRPTTGRTPPFTLGYSTSTAGTTFADQGAVFAEGDNGDDPCAVYVPTTNKIFIFYAVAGEVYKRVYLYETTPEDIVSGTFIDRGLVYDAGFDYIPSDVFYDYESGMLMMINATTKGAYSYDGITWTASPKDIPRPLSASAHTTFVRSDSGYLEGIIYNPSITFDDLICSFRTAIAQPIIAPYLAVNAPSSLLGNAQLLAKAEADNTDILRVYNAAENRVVTAGTDADGDGVLYIRDSAGSTQIQLLGETGDGVFSGDLAITGDIAAGEVGLGTPVQAGITATLKAATSSSAVIRILGSNNVRLMDVLMLGDAPVVRMYDASGTNPQAIILDASTGTITSQLLTLQNLPTSAGSTGVVWNDGGTLKIS